MFLAIAILVAWTGWVLFSAWVLNNPRGEADLGFVYHLVRAYAWFYQRLAVEGPEHVPNSPGPLIVVCNHTSGVDPVLVQAICRFEIRWMMARDMMLDRYSWFWDWTRVIAVDRESARDTGSARVAIRHLRSGGVLGVFPEGGIEAPPGRLRPFKAGVGLLVARTSAPVLPIFITGTPVTERAWDSIRLRGHALLKVGAPMRFEPSMRPEAIALHIQNWFQHVSGWAVAADSPR